MNALKKTFLMMIAAFIVFTHCGCTLLIVPEIYKNNLMKGGNKDLSADFEKGEVVGKEYETLQTFYIRETTEGGNLYIQIAPTTNHINSIQPKTRFKVCKVVSSTWFSTAGEHCNKRILAVLINEQGMPIPTNNSQGKPSLIDVSSLFKSSLQTSDESWIYEPKASLIQEIK